MWFRGLFKRAPAPAGFGNGKVVPEETESWPSRVLVSWVSPLLSVGYSRPLEADDLWSLPPSRLTGSVTECVETAFYHRCEPSKRPRFMRDAAGQGNDDKTKRKDDPSGVYDEAESPQVIDAEKRESPKVKSAYDESLLRAFHETFMAPFWVAGILNLICDTLRTTTPLVSRVFLTWLSEVYAFHRLSEEDRALVTSDGLSGPQGIGYGIGLAFAIFLMQQISSFAGNYSAQMAMTIGQSLRAAVTGMVFRKSLRMSNRARQDHSVGQIVTVISTDATNLDMFSAFAVHQTWIAPIQLILGFGLLIGTLGYSALVGLGVIVIGFPIQGLLVYIMYAERNKGIKITDERVLLTTEVLQGIRLIKFYGWESFYVQQIGKLRQKEIAKIRNVSIASSSLLAAFQFIPVAATILSFITYSLTGHELDVATVFTALQLFNTIRLPLLLLPYALGILADALVAIPRITKLLLSPDLEDPYILDRNAKDPIHVDADFTWEAVQNLEGMKESKDGSKGAADVKETKKKKGEKSQLPISTRDVDLESDTVHSEPEPPKPFELINLRFDIPRGALVGIVGRVGSGKSSLLQAIIGEMRKTRGEVVVGGSIAYVPQVPWIQNTTLRENVIFGQPDDEERFREIIRDCSLERDLSTLPHREMTEIGEKGVNISGGQKARVSLARAAYSTSDIVLLDDPLSAVDAYVGKAIFEDCILSGPLASRTRVLVAHSLHVLDKLDYIYVMDKGSIVERGTYQDLITNGLLFSRLIEEYGQQSLDDGSPTSHPTTRDVKIGGAQENKPYQIPAEADALMQSEERNIGAVGWDVYKRYLWYAGGVIWVPIVMLLLSLNQAASVGDNLWLGFWTSDRVPHFSQGHYMAVYASFGIAQAIFSFMLGITFALITLQSSFKLFNAALLAILRSPLSFFDTTPMGRIVSRLSKDQSILDNELAPTLHSFLIIFISIFGVIALVFYTFPYLGIIFLPMGFFYYLMFVYYRRTSVETKRLESVLRSSLFAALSESLTGLSTIRAYGRVVQAVEKVYHGNDLQNRAYYMTISIQRWLAIRLDVFVNILLLGVGLFACGFRTSVDPAIIAVLLSNILGITQVFAEIISQFAQTEQNMNSAERLMHYADLSSEAGLRSESDPPLSWPANGEIKFEHVQMAYREGLPLVLKNVNLHIKSQEKIGIVGRTGAGKSSLLHALFRTAELSGGVVEIDGVDISTVGLETLRTRLALVPQDCILFLGTLRENLDPHKQRTDAELISVLQRASLLPPDGVSDPVAEAKFSLDSVVGNEGSNMSAGERQLIALCRALVRNSRIIILDEATSNVDVETDSKVQRTIQREFASSTLLCIAHRLNTIAYYDRILVMDGGRVAEFDTVLNLYDNEGSIFRSLCDEAKLSRSDILKIRGEHGGGDASKD